MIRTLRPMSAALALLALLVLAAAGCERSPAGTVPDKPTSEATNGVGAGEAGSGKTGAGGEAAPSCQSIEDCDSFLSCIDGTCQEPPAVTGQHSADTPVVRFVDGDGQTVATFFVELALTPAEHQKGLMYRRQMKDDWGMLFIYPDEGTRSFWMENTFISLDMIFIDGKGRIVNIFEDVEPLTRTRRTSRGPARYVLELNAGRAGQVGLEPGQRMQLEHVAKEHMPTSRREP